MADLSNADARLHEPAGIVGSDASASATPTVGAIGPVPVRNQIVTFACSVCLTVQQPPRPGSSEGESRVVAKG